MAQVTIAIADDEGGEIQFTLESQPTLQPGDEFTPAQAAANDILAFVLGRMQIGMPPVVSRPGELAKSLMAGGPQPRSGLALPGA